MGSEIFHAHFFGRGEEKIVHGLRTMLDEASSVEARAGATREDEREIRMRVAIPVGVAAAI